MPGEFVLGVGRPPGPPTGLPEHPHSDRQLASQSESRAEAAVSWKLALDSAVISAGSCWCHKSTLVLWEGRTQGVCLGG